MPRSRGTSDGGTFGWLSKLGRDEVAEKVRIITEPLLILGVDPGDTTGLALIQFPEVDAVFFRSCSLEELYDTAHRVIEKVDHVAIERFTISQRTIRNSRHVDALYAIGWMKGLCHNAGIPIHLQTPADAKSAFRDESLRQLGVYSTSRHNRDATRHSLLCGRRLGHVVHISV